jgi:copper chaperone NosL
MKGGMGADEAVPFLKRAAAEKFVSDKGGRIVSFKDVPRDYVLTRGTEARGLEPANQPPRPEQAP